MPTVCCPLGLPLKPSDIREDIHKSCNKVVLVREIVFFLRIFFSRNVTRKEDHDYVVIDFGKIGTKKSILVKLVLKIACPSVREIDGETLDTRNTTHGQFYVYVW